MTSLRVIALSLFLAVFVGDIALAADSKDSDQRTIKDLGKKPVAVKQDTKLETNAGKAMENYRKFLELQKTDPQLRAESMRRLGDLNLDAGEVERMEKEVTAIDLQGGEAIKLYATLLKAYPNYARNDQVLYQLADGRSAISPGRAAVLGEEVCRVRKGLRRGHQAGQELALLRAEPLQARLVAVQAVADGREPALVRRRARCQAHRRGQQAGADRGSEARRSRARGRYPAGDEHHFLVL
jgi:hypothetical protein